MTAAEAADRELRLVVEKLRAWADNPPPAMEGLAPAAAFAFAAGVIESHDHRRDGAPPDVQDIERRVDLLTWLHSEHPVRYTATGLACELAEIESVLVDDLRALERSGLVARGTVAGHTVWGCGLYLDERVSSTGLRALVSQVEP